MSVCAGVHTVEGNVAGVRAAQLTKEREKQQSEYLAVRNKIKGENSTSVSRIDEKFNCGSDSLEQEFRERTVGLVSAKDFREAREVVDKAKKESAANQRNADEKDAARLAEKKARQRAEKRKKMVSALSFDMDDGEEEEEVIVPPKKVSKNPDVDTSHLPDRQRDEAIAREKERLRREWEEQQEAIKGEMIEVTYSFWDGSGHRKAIEVKKGCTIGRFLEFVKLQLSPEFPELRCVGSDSLMYVKEDLIIPHHISFYDLIITKARGKSGPLFHFDVHDDIRIVNDVRVEKDESHPGKVCERRWYERNKHIFPASRWEIYDPNVKRDGKYSIHGDETKK